MARPSRVDEAMRFHDDLAHRQFDPPPFMRSEGDPGPASVTPQSQRR
jgi:hypothetical protein